MGKCQLWGLAVDNESDARTRGGRCERRCEGRCERSGVRREEGARLFTVERRVNLPSRTTDGRQQIEIQLATGRNSRMRRDETYEALPICLQSGLWLCGRNSIVALKKNVPCSELREELLARG